MGQRTAIQLDSKRSNGPSGTDWLSGSSHLGSNPSRTALRAGPNGFEQDFSRVPASLITGAHPPVEASRCPISPRTCPFGGACHSCPVTVQAKLKVGEPDDEYEREADRVADQVMRMPHPGSGDPPISDDLQGQPVIQRACEGDSCEPEDLDEEEL